MGNLWQDLRYAVRVLAKSPGFTVVALISLMLGIGANTAIFSIIHGAMKLPYRGADRMVVAQTVYPRRSYFAASWRDFHEWRKRNKSFEELAALFTDRMTWRGSNEPESLNIGLITEGYFRMYGMQPILGRGFLLSDHEQGAIPVCDLSETFWREELNGDASVVGKLLDLDGKTCTVVGVMPRVLPDSNHPAQVWIPMEPSPRFQEHNADYSVLTIGLLRPGVSRNKAVADLRSIQTQINQQFGDNAHDVDLQDLSQNIFGDLRSIMRVLMAAVGFILLITCVNLANMLLARGAGRSREFALRRSLGAPSGRILQQTLTESLLLSFGGALIGLVFAKILTHLPISAWPKGFLPLVSVRLDGTVLTFTALLAVATAGVFGVIPTLRILREDPRPAFQQGRASTESRQQSHMRSILIISEIALCMLLVAGSLDMAFYYMRLMRVDSGVNPRNVLSVGVSFPPHQPNDGGSDWRFYDSLSEKVAALPGVTHVAATLVPPFWGASPSGRFQYEGQPKGPTDQDPFADFDFVSPGYFATVQSPILYGRDFNLQDQPNAPKVAIINRAMAQKLWPGESAIGKQIHCCVQEGDFTVIGVANDVRSNGPARPAGNEIYITMEQSMPSAMTLLVRTTNDPSATVKSLRHAIFSVNPGQPISNITSLEALADRTIAGQRTSTIVAVILGMLALLLASIGVYGVMAYSISRREREIGIRIALGSSRSGIMRLVLYGVLRSITLGVILGASLSIATQTWIASLLCGSGTHAFALLASTLLLCGVAAIATLIPTRRAMKIDPMVALRAE